MRTSDTCVATDIELRLLKNLKGRMSTRKLAELLNCAVRHSPMPGRVNSFVLFFGDNGVALASAHRTSIPQTKTAAAAVATQIRSAQHVQIHQLKHTQHIANNSPQ